MHECSIDLLTHRHSFPCYHNIIAICHIPWQHALVKFCTIMFYEAFQYDMLYMLNSKAYKDFINKDPGVQSSMQKVLYDKDL